MYIYIYIKKRHFHGGLWRQQSICSLTPGPSGQGLPRGPLSSPPSRPLCHSSPPPALHTCECQEGSYGRPQEENHKSPQTRNERPGLKRRQYPGKPAQNWSPHLQLESEERSQGFEVIHMSTTQEYSIRGVRGVKIHPVLCSPRTHPGAGWAPWRKWLASLLFIQRCLWKSKGPGFSSPSVAP